MITETEHGFRETLDRGRYSLKYKDTNGEILRCEDVDLPFVQVWTLPVKMNRKAAGIPIF